MAKELAACYTFLHFLSVSFRGVISGWESVGNASGGIIFFVFIERILNPRAIATIIIVVTVAILFMEFDVIFLVYSFVVVYADWGHVGGEDDCDYINSFWRRTVLSID